MLSPWLLDQAFDVLDSWFESGLTRMISMPSWLVHEFKIDKQTANRVL